MEKRETKRHENGESKSYERMEDKREHRKGGSIIHESSVSAGTGSGNLYKHVPQNAIQKSSSDRVGKVQNKSNNGRKG